MQVSIPIESSRAARSARCARFERYFKEYASYHRSRANQMTHYFGIPLIVIGLFGLLSQVSIRLGEFSFLTKLPMHGMIQNRLQIDGGGVLLICGMIWYTRLDRKILIPFGLVLAGFYFFGRSLGFAINLVFFALGWALQGLGHAVYEKRSPAFLTNLTHLMIGPLWIFAKMIRYQLNEPKAARK